ncbi:MAG: BatD family protein [Planctomycetes bacterium]|nr:BatD family protein [Planctomycetota bacterium]
MGMTAHRETHRGNATHPHRQGGWVGAWLLGFVAVCLFAASASAEDAPEIRVAASAEEIFIGEAIDYQVEIRNSKNPMAPDLTALKKLFDVVAQGDESHNQSSTFIVNGRVSQQNIFSHVYLYRLTPKESGSLMIPAVTATIDGKTLTSRPLSLRVVPAEVQDLVLVEIEPSQTQVYPTQPFDLTLRVLVRPLPNSEDANPLQPLRQQPPHLQVNWVDPIPGLSTDDKAHWLQPLLARDGVGFTLNDVSTRSGSFFDGPKLAALKLAHSRQTRDGLDGDPIRYHVYELTRTMTPEKTGVYELGPATVKGAFVSGVEKDELIGRRLVAIAPAVSIEVKEVPLPRPPTYCGGIGEYQISASANPTKLRVGDPLTLTIELERGTKSGSLELVSAPDLESVPQLAADFELIDKNPTGRIEGSIKRFAYAMRPKRPGVSLPALSVSTFDPGTAMFTEINTSPIPLDVSEASRITSGDLIGSSPTSSTADIKTRTEGIFQNITDPSGLRDERISLATWGGAAAIAWCLAGGLMLAVTIHRRRSSDSAWVRRQQGRREANRRLSLARATLSGGQSQEALREVRAALIGLIADMQNRVADGLTTADVAAALDATTVPVESRDALLKLLESIESAEYGGGSAADPSQAIESAQSLVAKIAPHLERGA